MGHKNDMWDRDPLIRKKSRGYFIPLLILDSYREE